MRDFITMSPCRQIEGSVSLPGDKSISHRAALVSILAEGTIEIVGCSPAADVAASLAAVRSFGLSVTHEPPLEASGSEEVGPGSHILGYNRGKSATAHPVRQIDVGNSGTTLRIGLGIYASIAGTTYVDGDESINRRPMLRVVQPLRLMGADIAGRDGGEFTPLVVRGRDLSGADHVLPTASAQVKSALLLAGLRARGVTSVSEPARSRDHTERMLLALGVPIDITSNRLVVKSTSIQGGLVDVPADISAAAAFMAAAAIIPGSVLVLPRVGLNPTRTGFLDVLTAFGAEVTIGSVEELSGEPRGTITVRAGDRLPMNVGGTLALRAIDELPLVAVLGAFAEGETTVTGAGELRIKESDRITAVAAGLRSMGVHIEETPDGFVVRGGTPLLATADLDPHRDHRLAMAFAVAALGSAGPARILDPGCVAVSHPSFFEDLASVAVP